MAHNPNAPQGPQGQDPAASTQMFRAFVDEGGTPQAQARQTQEASGSRMGLVLGGVVVLVLVAAAAWFALS